MLALMRDGQARGQLARNASAYVAEHNWDVKKHEYLRLVDSLLSSTGLPQPALAQPSPLCR